MHKCHFAVVQFTCVCKGPFSLSSSWPRFFIANFSRGRFVSVASKVFIPSVVFIVMRSRFSLELPRTASKKNQVWVFLSRFGLIVPVMSLTLFALSFRRSSVNRPSFGLHYGLRTCFLLCFRPSSFAKFAGLDSSVDRQSKENKKGNKNIINTDYLLLTLLKSIHSNSLHKITFRVVVWKSTEQFRVAKHLRTFIESSWLMA